MGTIRSIELTGIKSDACKFISEIPFLMGGSAAIWVLKTIPALLWKIIYSIFQLHCHVGIKKDTHSAWGNH